MNTTKSTLYLSALMLSPHTITALETLGFIRRNIATTYQRESTAYHGIFPAWQADSELWKLITGLLIADTSFVGHLAEKTLLPYSTHYFTAQAMQQGKRELSLQDARTVLLSVLPKKKASRWPANATKSCDIQISVHWWKSLPILKKAFDSLGIASLDTPNGDGTFTRIFTLSFEDADEAKKCFASMSARLRHANQHRDVAEPAGTLILGFEGSLDMSTVSRIYRNPPESPLLFQIFLKNNNTPLSP